MSPIPVPPGCRAGAAVIEAKDAKDAALRAGLAGLRAELEAERELVRRLELRVAELERRLRMDSSDSGTPGSREPLGPAPSRHRRVHLEARWKSQYGGMKAGEATARQDVSARVPGRY